MKAVKSIKPEDFFKLIAIYSGVSDIKTIKDIYYGMVRTISKELNGGRVIKLPDWGEFSLSEYKARTTIDVNSGRVIQLPAKTLVKFTTDWKVKEYFYNWGK
jgi:nucleoid DNA-binding protein